MKKFLATIFFVFIALINYADAQSLKDYHTTESDVSLTYDNNWNPICKFSIKNISNKTITAIEIVIFYGANNPDDYFAPTEICRTITNIKPNERKILTFYPNQKDLKPKSFSLKRIRYSDGSISDR